MNKKKSGMSEKNAKEKPLRGIARRAKTKAAEAGGDETFSPDYTVTSTTDGGGKVLTDVEVILIFWGSFWTTSPAPTPSSDTYKTAIEGILTGPFMSGLRQYRGVGQGSLVYTEVYTGSDPSDLYTDSDVVNLIKDRLNNTSMPAPTSGINRFYAVIAPQGIRNSNTGFAGQHQSFTYNGATGYYAWVDNTGSLTGHDCTTKVFSHELVEACTNPDVDTSNNGILVDGKDSSGNTITDDEIGDTCNDQFFTLDMNGMQCSVQAYWSKADTICLLPTGSATFWMDKNTFGWDEVQDIISNSGGLVSKAFWLVVEGFSEDSFTALSAGVALPTGAFASLQGVMIAQNPAIDFENGADSSAQQRIRIPFDITFTNPRQSDFDGATYPLNSWLTLNGNKVPSTDAATEFELLAGADPYFSNIDPTQNNVFYLSQDLRVFTATPQLTPVPVPGGPTFADNSPGAAYAYVQSLLSWLNTNFNDPNGTDPFSSVLPAQGGAYSADSSVTPFTIQLSGVFPPMLQIYNNYNFAIARVRMRGTAGAAGEADNVRVFFRLWTSQTADTDYQPTTTYSGTPDAAGDPGSPNVGAGQTTIPFFATGDLGTNTDYAAGGVNNQAIEIPTNPPGRDTIWAYYGCFLNLYDPNNTVAGQQVQAWLTGTHHCLVAQIAYDDSPLFTGETPEASDRLAQRNLQVTHSDNPGPAATHRIPQTFNIRPTATGQSAVDELMIDWGAVPKGSTAAIYWPQVNAADVMALATAMYPANTLTAADAHTIQCKVTGGVSYIPIPKGSGQDFAGLFTIDLPTTVVTGQEFNVVVRRVGRAQAETIQIELKARGKKADAPPVNAEWRYIIGTFQVKVPVTTAAVMLRPEEDTLAILKWRLQQMSPANRWYPVMQRYIEYVADRVAGLGGDPSAIPPSLTGAPLAKYDPCEDVVHFEGKVEEVLFNCCGELVGFVLADCCERHRLISHEAAIGEIAVRALRERLTLAVDALRCDAARIKRLSIVA
ncbi:MAG: hypothetical protein WB680_08125 [Candidatus Acidiferrales bacterium]